MSRQPSGSNWGEYDIHYTRNVTGIQLVRIQDEYMYVCMYVCMLLDYYKHVDAHRIKKVDYFGFHSLYYYQLLPA